VKTVVFNLQPFHSALADFGGTWKTGKGDESAQIGFETWELMHKVLLPKRLEIIRVMAGAGPLSIREIARRVGRDFKGVHSDTRLLIEAGVIEKDDRGRLIFPYDRIHVDFEIPAAALNPVVGTRRPVAGQRKPFW
jgi:predicted transcriptional regulator